MGRWTRRIRAVIGLGLLWALGGLAVGAAIELVDNVLPAAHGFTRQVDMWPQTLALLAFRRGVVFAVLVALLGGRRRFEQFTYGQFTAWGALAGLAFGAVALALGASLVPVVITTLLSAFGGAASLGLARAAEARGLLGTADRATALGDGGHAAIGEGR